MSKFLENLEQRYKTPEEREADQKKVQHGLVVDAGRKLLRRASGREANEQDNALLTSMANNAINGPGDTRRRMPVPARGMRWGGFVSTARDELYCRCGRLKTDHPQDSRVCPRDYTEKK